MNNITNKWRQPLYKVNFLETLQRRESKSNKVDSNSQPANVKVGSIVAIAKSINYLARKKQDYELKIQTNKKNIALLSKEYSELHDLFDTYEF